MKYISDVIGEDYKYWDAKRPVLIETPMGSGKTYFALNVLLRFLHQQRKSMVYFTNRVALTKQVQGEIRLKDYCDSVTVCSYQQFAELDLFAQSKHSRGARSSALLAQRILEADYYVLDEAHYFLTDSSFNMKIDSCVKRMTVLHQRQRNSIWIYMTATMSYLFLFLRPLAIDIPYLQFVGGDTSAGLPAPHFMPFGSVRALLEYKEDHEIELATPWGGTETASTSHRIQQNYFTGIAHEYDQREDDLRQRKNSDFLYYGIPFDFPRVTPVYFTTRDEILKAIISTPSEEKWLIFTDSKEDGNYFKEKLIDIAQDRGQDFPKTFNLTETTFITSSSRKMKGLREFKTFENIISKERFEQRVVIATKVLDNGVNIKDPQLKHIVIDAYEKTEFLQMLGRKRWINEEDRAFLYIKNIPEGTLRRKVKNQTLSIVQFWRDLLVCQATPPKNKVYVCEPFLEHYTAGGQYKHPYQPAVQLKEHYVSTQDLYNGKYKLIDQYEPASYAKQKMTYNYYHLMSMFEQAQNERRKKIGTGIDKETDAESYEKLDLKLQQQQFMWLKEQLSWMGFTSQEYDPTKPRYWITEQMGWAQASREKLHAFLSHNTGRFLTENEESYVKELFRTWIQNVRPVHRNANSKGSKAIINQCFQEFQVPYRIRSTNKSIKGRQRNWWSIERLDNSSQES